MEMMDLIECSLGIGWCSLELFQGCFRRKIGEKSYNRVLGGVRVTEGGIRSCWETVIL